MASDKAGNVEVFDASHTRLFNFDVNGDRLKSDHIDYLLERAVPWLEQGGCVTIKGMASRSGSRDYNQRLSASRERSVISQLKTFVQTPYIFQVHGLGESKAESDGQVDGTEEERYRAVDIVFHSDPRPTPPPNPKQPKPKSPPPKRLKNVRARILSDTLDLSVVKRFGGRFFFDTPGVCSRFTAWHFSASTYGIGVPIKGKPSIWSDSKLDARGAMFWYNRDLFDPLAYWKDKPVYLSFSLRSMTLSLPNAIPRVMSKSYQPFGGSGVQISGTTIRFPMTIQGLELGAGMGVGSIKNPYMPARTDCA